MEGDAEGEHVLRGQSDEALVDHGKTSFAPHTDYEKEELESHRAVYVGVHVPLGRESKRRHRHRGHKHHRKKKERDSRDSDPETGRESPTHDTPSQRVQFLLGTEDDDVEHVPHDLFTELDELSFRNGGATEWKETARWLKFEEDVEDGGERWSKPYVATLSLHSLFELRSCILNGTVMLDMRANSIEEIADMLMDNMVASGQLEACLREKVREAMLKKHHHQNERKLSSRIPLVRSIADIGKKHSDPHLLDCNGEGLSASRHSLLKPGLSSSNLSQRRESRVSMLINHLLPGSASSTAATGCTPSPTPSPSPSPTPHSSPPLSRRPLVGGQPTPSAPAPAPAPSSTMTSPTPQQLHIPEVVVSPPTEEEAAEDEEETLRSVPPIRDEEASDAQPPHTTSRPGLLPAPEGKYFCSPPV